LLYKPAKIAGTELTNSIIGTEANSNVSTDEGLRLIHAFRNIRDKAVRDALISLAESYASLSNGSDQTDKTKGETIRPATIAAS
jgi:hypothetical protein